jgi:hypothetical protein
MIGTRSILKGHRAPSLFSICDGPDTQIILELDDLLDRVVRGHLEFLSRTFLSMEQPAFLQQRLGTEERADVL